LSHPLTEALGEKLIRIANTPSRLITRLYLERAVYTAISHGKTVDETLRQLSDASDSPLTSQQRHNVRELHSFLTRIVERIKNEISLPAHELLLWMVRSLDYTKHYDNYYGDGEESADRKLAISEFVEYASKTKLSVMAFVDHVATLDPSQGEKNQQNTILVTTVFRQKGAEYDYVVLPRCDEGFMPCHYETRCRTFDKENVATEPEPSEALENERRLFYVALTRAKIAVFVGSCRPPDKGVSEKGCETLPSRFISEMRVPDTLAAMWAIHRIASGELQSSDEVVAIAREACDAQIIRDNFLAYLSKLGKRELLQSVSNAFSGAAETPFVYPFAYPTIQDRQRRRDKVKNAAELAKERGTSWERVRRT
jgi:superfamily I DNA/RNA helicase